MSAIAQVVVRVFIAYPKDEADRALDCLPEAMWWLKDEGKSRVVKDWFDEHTAVVKKDFEALAGVLCVKEIHLLHLDRVVEHDIAELYQSWEVGAVHVMEKASGGQNFKLGNRDNYETGLFDILDM